MKLRYLSMCSGIEVASLAWRPLGWVPVAFAEIEPFPCAVLAHHYPDVTNLGDMTCIDGTQLTGLVDVLVAGTPCQAFSVAGLREGLSDSRGNLTLKFVELANAIKPSVAVVWENVPGVLSMRDNAFGCFLAGLAGSDGPLVPARPGRWPDAGLVFGPIRAIAWRVLDAQYFGLAQRRRRVFVVACPRNGLNPAEILFEFDGVRRDTPPRRETRTDIAGTLEASPGRSRGAGTSPGACVDVCQSLTRSFGNGGPDDNKAQAGFYVADLAPTLRAGGNKTGGDRPVGTDVDTCESLVGCFSRLSPVSQYGDVAGALTSEGSDASPCSDRGPTVIAFHGSQDPDVSGDVTHPVGRNQGQETCVAYSAKEQCSEGWAPEIVRQAISCKWSKGTSGPSRDEHHNLVCTPVATTVTARNPSRGADSDFTSTHVIYSSFSTSGAGIWRPEFGPLRARPQDSHENLCVAIQAGALRENPASGPQSKGFQRNLAYTLEARAEVQAIAFTERGRAEGRTFECQEEQAYCLANPSSGGRTHSRQIMTPQMQVRRLTPMECERLQGIPDNYTLIPYKRFAGLPANIIRRSYMRYLARMARQGKPPLPLGDLLKCADGPRYKAIGNGMARNVMQWIGERIEMALAAKGVPHA